MLHACFSHLRVAFALCICSLHACASHMRVALALRICTLHACVSHMRVALAFAFALSLACVAGRLFRRVLARRLRISCVMLRLRMLPLRLARCSCIPHVAAARRACGVRASPLIFTPLLGPQHHANSTRLEKKVILLLQRKESLVA
jgi:hypothetical protein